MCKQTSVLTIFCLNIGDEKLRSNLEGKCFACYRPFTVIDKTSTLNIWSRTCISPISTLVVKCSFLSNDFLSFYYSRTADLDTSVYGLRLQVARVCLGMKRVF